LPAAATQLHLLLEAPLHISATYFLHNIVKLFTVSSAIRFPKIPIS